MPPRIKRLRGERSRETPVRNQLRKFTFESHISFRTIVEFQPDYVLFDIPWFTTFGIVPYSNGAILLNGFRSLAPSGKSNGGVSAICSKNCSADESSDYGKELLSPSNKRRLP
jgi:hypothetical protein